MEPAQFRIGQGIDIHPFEKGRRFVLGGVEIPSPLGLKGHSDADALLHALTDALLGAIGAGDIGQHFPDRDSKWKDCASSLFVQRAMELVAQRGFRVINADCTILAQLPKLAPFYQTMRSSVASLLGLELECVSIKATTAEGLGFVGRSEGLWASAVVLLQGAGRG